MASRRTKINNTWNGHRTETAANKALAAIRSQFPNNQYAVRFYPSRPRPWVIIKVNG